jgi:hypothetical protein
MAFEECATTQTWMATIVFTMVISMSAQAQTPAPHWGRSVPHVAHCRVASTHIHRIRLVGPQQVNGRLIRRSVIKPSRPLGVTPVWGSVSIIDAASATIQTAQGPVKVQLLKSLVVYSSSPSVLSHVSANTFAGVTSVKGSDGMEHATEVQIFPEALHGVGEGSYKIAGAQPDKPSSNRMTNGAISGPRMTKPAVVSNGSGSEIIVGDQHIDIPAGTPVTLIVPTQQPLHQGSMVLVLAKKRSNGDFFSDKIMTFAAK